MALGAPMTLRTDPGTEGMPGLLLDRVDHANENEDEDDDDDDANDANLASLLATVRERSRAALAHFIPHRTLRRLLNSANSNQQKHQEDGDAAVSAAPPSLSRPIVDVVVTFHTATESAERRTGFALGSAAEVVEVGVEQSGGRPRGVAKFPVMIEFTDDGEHGDGGLRVEMEWDAGVVEPAVAERLEEALAGALEALGAASRDAGRGVSVRSIVDALRRAAGGAEGDGDGGLPTPREEEQIAAQLGGDGADVAARAERVVAIREAMAECLGLERKDIGCMRSFWDLGAESMDAVRLQDACEKRDLHLGLRDIFDSPTADALAGLCQASV